MKKTLEWMAPDRTRVDSISVLTLGLETLISRIGALDAHGAANSGAMKALDGGVRLPLRDVVDDSLEWVGDINRSLTEDSKRLPVGALAEETKAVLVECYAARSELRRSAASLASERDNVYSSLTQLKDITTSVRSALATVVDAVGNIPHDAELVTDEPRDESALSHVYQLSRRARVEHVMRPTDEDRSKSVVLFTEVSKASSESRRPLRDKSGLAERPRRRSTGVRKPDKV